MRTIYQPHFCSTHCSIRRTLTTEVQWLCKYQDSCTLLSTRKPKDTTHNTWHFLSIPKIILLTHFIITAPLIHTNISHAHTTHSRWALFVNSDILSQTNSLSDHCILSHTISTSHFLFKCFCFFLLLQYYSRTSTWQSTHTQTHTKTVCVWGHGDMGTWNNLV